MSNVSENEVANLGSLLDDLCIVLAGKRSRYYGNSPEKSVFDESYARLSDRGMKLLRIRAAFKQVQILNTRLEVAKANYNYLSSDPQDEKVAE